MADIFLLALVAAFIALRLRSVLGQRPERDAQQQGGWAPPGSNVVELTSRYRNGIGAVMAADPGFDPNGFLQGAKGAFTLIVNAVSIGDTATLRPLVSDEVFANFVKALEEQSLEQVQIVDVIKAEIIEASLVGSGAEVVVQFVSDQQLRGQVSRVTDIWTFYRRLQAKDPTWVLVATRAAAAP